MSRIELQYPMYTIPDDPLERQREQQEAFMKSRTDFLLGRDEIIHKVY